MTRDEFVRKFHWNKIIWVVGIISVVALVPQPLKILQTHSVKDISLSMFLMLIIVQAGFATEFYLKKSWGPMICQSICAVLSMLTVGLVLFYR
jgi:uncharacterized protein with PQ loop repeat